MEGNSTISISERLEALEKKYETLAKYTEYLAENLNTSIAFSEYIAGKCNGVIETLVNNNSKIVEDLKNN